MFTWTKGQLELSREAGQSPELAAESSVAEGLGICMSGVKVVLCMQDVSTEFISKAKQDKLLPHLRATLERLG